MPLLSWTDQGSGSTRSKLTSAGQNRHFRVLEILGADRPGREKKYTAATGATIVMSGKDQSRRSCAMRPI